MNSIVSYLSIAQKKIFNKLGVSAHVSNISVDAHTDYEPIYHNLRGQSHEKLSARYRSPEVRCNIDLILDHFPDKEPDPIEKLDQPQFTLRDIESLFMALSLNIKSEEDCIALQKQFNQWRREKLLEVDVYAVL